MHGATVAACEKLERRLMLTLSSLDTNPITVNTQTADYQYRSDVATDASGDFVVVWESYGQDGGGYGIYGQIFNVDGTRRGSEFRVNSTTAGDQRNVSVAMDDGGDFVVVWESEQAGGVGMDVYAQRFDAAGAKAGGEFRVNTFLGTAGNATEDQDEADVAMDGAGNFVVTWTSWQDGSGVGAMYRLFNADGSARTGELLANTYTRDHQAGPAVAMNAAGDFAIVWHSNLQDFSDFGVYGQRFNAAGGKVGGEFHASTNVTGPQYYPDVAIDSAGNVVVVWIDGLPSPQGNGKDGSGWGIFGQRFGGDGSRQGGEFQVNTTTNQNQSDPRVDFAPDGNFLVTWSSAHLGPNRVMGQEFTAAGVKTGGEFMIGPSTYGQGDSAVAWGPSRQAVVAWDASVSGGPYDVYVRRYSPGFNSAPTARADSYTVNQNTTLQTMPAPVPVLDQSSTALDYQFNAGASGLIWQQQVTAGRGGVLQSVDVYVGEFSDPGAYFTFFVNRGAAWQTDAHEFSRRIDVTQAMIDGWITIDVSSAGISLTQGERFTIGASGGGGGDAFLMGSDRNPYAGGALWWNLFGNGETVSGGGDDLAFRTRVTPTSTGPLGVLANDTDSDGDALTALLVTGPAHGTLALDRDGSFVYTPNANYSGADGFTYRASDGLALSTVATVAITVVGPNDPPVVSDLAVTLDEDSSYVGYLTATDPEGDPLTLTVTAGPGNGRAFLRLDQSAPLRYVLTYYPNSNYFGTDSLTYAVSDGTNTVSATVTFTVNPVNDAPFTGAQGFVTDEDVPLSSRLDAVDVESDPITYTLARGPLHGTVTVNADGTFTYTPEKDFSGRYVYFSPDISPDLYGSDSFVFRVTDDKGASRTGTAVIDVTPVDDAPVAADDALTVGEDRTLTISAPPVSRLVMRSEPNDWVGAGKSYDYSAAALNFDGRKNADNGVRLWLTGPNDWWDLNFAAPFDALLAPGEYLNAMRFPFQNADRPGLDVSGNGRGENQLLGAFTVYDVVWSADRSDVLSFAAKFEQHGVGTGGTVNPAALLGTIQYNTTFGTKAGVLANDADGDGDFLTTVLVSGPAHGTLTLNRDGTLSYRPDANFSGTDSFRYFVTDGALASEVATVTITVTPENDAPVFGSASYAFTIPENRPAGAAVGTVSATDPDGDGVSYSLAAGNASGAFAIDAATGAITVADASKLDYEAVTRFTLTVRATEGGAGDLFSDVAVVVDLTDIPSPRVTGVRYQYGDGGMWIAAADLAGRTASGKVTKVELTFDVTVTADLADLSATGMGGAVAFSAFAADAAARTATWTFASAVESDRLQMVLDGDGAADGNDGVGAAGEYLLGGDYALAVDVLFGDVNGSGVVTSADWQRARALVGTSDPYADVNGNGIVTSADAQLVRNAVGGTLPAAGTGTGEGTGTGSGAGDTAAGTGTVTTGGTAAAVEESSPVVVCLAPAPSPVVVTVSSPVALLSASSAAFAPTVISASSVRPSAGGSTPGIAFAPAAAPLTASLSAAARTRPGAAPAAGSLLEGLFADPRLLDLLAGGVSHGLGSVLPPGLAAGVAQPLAR